MRKPTPPAFLWFSLGCFFALALHYFIPCEQAQLGHPRIQVTAEAD